MSNSSNTTIAKNTLFMYFRMALVILVGLYSARVILNALGVVDYGIYNVAGSVVAMFGFLNGALATSSSRFITIELGKKESEEKGRLTRCFTTTRGIHGLLAIVILVISETIGLWILYTQCEIPAERMSAAVWVYQISVITSMLSITLVPYSSLIIAHEHMVIYAYVGVIEAVLKLLVCYLIQISPIDNLVFYALLIFAIQVANNLFNRFYCRLKFNECSFKYSLDKQFFKPIVGFSGWNLLGSFSYMAITQFATIMVSFFFGPAIVAARAIAAQVRNIIFNFINNFRVAVNPQILKKHAVGDINGSKRLIFFSTSLSFYLLLLILLPFLFETDFILELWLKNVPDYAVGFSRLMAFELLTGVYGISFYMIFQAYGRLKENAILCPITDILTMTIVGIIYYCGGPVLTIAWAILVLSIVQCCVIKPLLAIRLFGYKWKDFSNVYVKNLSVFIVSCISPFIIFLLYNDIIGGKIMVMISSVIGVVLFTYLIGFNKKDRTKIKEMIISYYHRSFPKERA